MTKEVLPMLRRVKVHNVEFILLSVYITSKLLWDKIPYIFELFFYQNNLSCLSAIHVQTLILHISYR